MINQLCTALVLVLGLSLTAHSQCFLLDEGKRSFRQYARSSGFVFQIGYSESDRIGSGGFKFGYAHSRDIEVGVGLTYLYSGLSPNITAGRQYLDLYPIRLGDGGSTVIFGLHQSYVSYSRPSLHILSGGVSMNVLLLNQHQTGVISTIGVLASKRTSSREQAKALGVAGIGLVSRLGGKNPIGLMFEFSTMGGVAAYSVGLAYTISLN